MPKLAAVLPKDLLKTLIKLGFSIFHQSGSHVRLHHFDGRKTTLSIHPKPLPKGTLAAIRRAYHIPSILFEDSIFLPALVKNDSEYFRYSSSFFTSS